MDFNREYCSQRYNDDLEDDQIHEFEVGNIEKGNDELLIDAVKCYPHLYNSSLKEFKDVQLKENSWSEIAKIMDMSIATCQNRWVRLRDRFTKEKRLREIETRSGSGATHRSAFPLYNNLLFLENHIKRRKSYTNVTSPAAKKRLIDVTNTSSSHSINIATSNISPSNRTISNIDSFPNLLSSIPSMHSKVSNTDFDNKNLPHLYPDISIHSHGAPIVNFIPIHPNIQENDIRQTGDVIECNRLSSPPQCETHSLSGMSRATSVSRDSTPSPALQTFPIKTKMDSSNRIKNKSNTYLEHSLVSLSDSLQKRMADQSTNQCQSQQMYWNFNDLTLDKTFGLLVAMELERISEPEKSKRKQAITDILWKPVT